ncbi:hypothetical protein GIS00_04355 [Nakamurella sp. YIM 132087]|uniref:Uncharacterized protein n=1 Tax=Nakamurella alba TaxID=2665158 RepID=A0A7K1FGF1_9ACTN|nr:hypothetical protein [Nakamurella alba]
MDKSTGTGGPGRGARHLPLRLLAAADLVIVIGALVGMIVDDRELVGLNIWDKPMKFALSILIYAVTWAWLIEQLPRFRRIAWWSGTIAAVFLAVEMVVIVGQTFRMTTSHFNVATPFDTAAWSLMGASIAVVWGATLVLSVLLFRVPGADRARTVAIRWGALIALVGMALGFLMTSPTAQQLAAAEGGAPMDIVGAHTVGVPDGGPGLPILGWSTVAGDLRIPHFLGMHALQLIPIVLILLELLARRGVRQLRSSDTRRRLVHVAAIGWSAVIGITTWQALRGQSIVRPDGLTLAALGITVIGVVVAAAAVLRVGRTRVTA